MEKKNLTLQDLEDAVETINRFSALYRKAQMAVKNLSKEQGRYGGMMGRGTDPITSMLFGSLEGMVDRKLEQLADAKVKQMAGALGSRTIEEVEELEEAKSGLNASEEEEEEEETR